MEFIPDEILVRLFHFVAKHGTVHDAGNLPRVCRRWQCLCADESVRKPLILVRRLQTSSWVMSRVVYYRLQHHGLPITGRFISVLGDVLASTQPNTVSFVLSPRQFGKTTAIAVQAFLLIIRGKSCRILATSLRESNRIFLAVERRVRCSLPGHCFLAIQGTTIRLQNGARLAVEPYFGGSERQVTGINNAVCITDWAAGRDWLQLLRATIECRRTRGVIVFVGTPGKCFLSSVRECHSRDNVTLPTEEISSIETYANIRPESVIEFLRR